MASLVPRKGHDMLLRALAEVPRTDWLLTCVGSHYRSPATVQRLCAQIEAEGLEDHVRLVGEVDAATLAEHYDSADVFVLPTRHEGYGMAVAEALAHGLPVVSTPTGAIADLVGRDAGMLVPPGDAEALTAALWRVLDDDGLRQRLREGARRVRNRLPTWADQSAMMADALERGRPVMGAFSPDWLALREPADAEARSSRLTRLVGDALPHDLVHALDLGTGTGANVRYLAGRLPVRQDWLLVDDDPQLIEEAARTCASGVVRRVDLVDGDRFDGASASSPAASS